MATTRYYDPSSGTWKTEQATPGGAQVTISQVYNLTATLSGILSRLTALEATDLADVATKTWVRTGGVAATQTFVDDRIAETLAQNPSVPDDIQAQLNNKVDKAAMSNVQYTLIIPLGETGPSTRPAEAGNRPILQKGGPMPLPWIDRSKGDDWLGVLNA